MTDLFPHAPLSVSIDDQIACIERELRYRVRVYARRIAEGKMTQVLGDHEIGKMRAVLETLHRAKAGRRGGRPLL